MPGVWDPRELLDSAQSQSLQANSPQPNPKKGSRTGPSFVAKAFLTALHHSPLTPKPASPSSSSTS